ncbi:MAG: hypothetical protein KA537_00790 [Candidatus Moranbacteria bacterium]|nr:hypothetical protein [Candidatus Moranbacteria bacterium]
MEKSEDLRDDDQNEESEEDEGRERYDQEDKNRSVKTKLPGMVIPYLESDNGGIEIGY